MLPAGNVRQASICLSCLFSVSKLIALILRHVQNKKTVTVPLAFRLAPDPNKVNHATVAPPVVSGSSSARGAPPDRGVAGESVRERGDGGGSKLREAVASHPGSQHKENDAVQNGQLIPSSHVGAPSEQIMYPAAFNRTSRVIKRDSHASTASSRLSVAGGADRPIGSGFALRPLSTRDVSAGLASEHSD